MKTLINAICTLSLLASAGAASAHMRSHFHPNRSNDLQAISPSVAPSLVETSPLSFGTGEDSRESATGGPAGGLIDRN